MTYKLEDTSPRLLAFCLVFTNSASWHASPHPEEHITSLKFLIDWEEKLGILSPGWATKLRLIAEKDINGAENARLKAITLREAMYRVFAAVVANQAPNPDDMASIDEILQQGMSKAGLIHADGTFTWGWGDDDVVYDYVLWPAAHSAARLLSDKKLRGMIRQCADDRGCGWFFLDRSRNHSRRWCSMKVCGNRAKAQRHYQRQRLAV